MSSEQIRRAYQPRLAFPKTTLWEKLPKPTRLRVRQLLTQMLQQAILNPATERSGHERKN
jgi:hypothetical protein